jgi:signal transduction histidine kinase
VRQPPATEALHEALFGVLEILASEGELAEQLAAVHRTLWSVMDASNLYVALYDPTSALYFFPYNADEDDEDFAPQPLPKSLTDYVRRTGRPLLCRNADYAALVASGEVEPIGQSGPVWLGAPLVTARGNIGAVVVQSYTDPDALTEVDLPILVWMARAMAITLERRWTEERERAESAMRLRDLQLSRDEALRASQEKSRFLANMSHELRTPLNAILGYTDLLLDEVEQGEVANDLRSIRRAATHLRALIDGILDLTQVESGRLELTPTPFNVTALFDEVWLQALPLAAHGQNQLVRVGDAAAGSVETDRRSLLQVVLNLVGNACKFTANGTISLRAAAVHRGCEDWLRLEVADTGIGIDPLVLPRLFEAFTQVDPSTTRSHGGSGLGLTIVKRLVERLGGELEGASVPGRGTTFTVQIPARAKGLSASAPASAAGEDVAEAGAVIGSS